MDHSIRGHFWAQWKSESWCMPSSPEKAARMCLPRVSSRSLTMRHEYENTLKSFAAAGGKKGKFFSLPELARQYPQVRRLPVSLRIVLESVLRNCDGNKVTREHVEQLDSSTMRSDTGNRRTCRS